MRARHLRCRPWYDNNAAALILVPGPFPPSPPEPPVAPPLPPLPPISSTDGITSFIVARYVARETLTPEMLDRLLTRTSADIDLEILQMLVVLPTAFSDMLAVPSCDPDALETVRATLGRIWGVNTSAVSDMQCSFGGSSTFRRRRRLLATPGTRDLLQAVGACAKSKQWPASACCLKIHDVPFHRPQHK